MCTNSMEGAKHTAGITAIMGCPDIVAANKKPYFGKEIGACLISRIDF